MVPSNVETMLLERYMYASVGRARAQFAWRPHPLVMIWMPITVTGEGFFQLLPDGIKPTKRDWHWVLLVRTGLETPDNSQSGQAKSYALESTIGRSVLDLVACTPDLSKPVARLLCTTAVIGNPLHGETAVDPVRVHATPLSWLSGGCEGVVPVGTEYDTQAYLRSCQAGIVADSVAHGQALLTKMRRELPPLPKVIVAA